MVTSYGRSGTVTRLFRGLYDEVRVIDESKITFSMDASHLKSKIKWLKAWLFLTPVLFYGTMILAILIVYHILF